MQLSKFRKRRRFSGVRQVDRQTGGGPESRPTNGRGPRPDSQLRDARLAHRRGDGFDRGAERVEQLGQLASATSLPALLHDEAGQGADVRVEGRLVRHAGPGCRCRAAGAGDRRGQRGSATGAGKGARDRCGGRRTHAQCCAELAATPAWSAESLRERPKGTYRARSPRPAPGTPALRPLGSASRV